MQTLLESSIGKILYEKNDDYTKLYDLELQKEPCKNSKLTSVYWFEVDNDIRKFPWFDCLVLKPTKNPMICNTSLGKPIAVWYKHANGMVGVPRYFGLSTFGIPKEDLRKDAELMDVQFETNLKDTQIQIVDPILSQIRSPWHGATLIADCGVGKTAMAIYIACKLKQKTAIVCTGEILIDQWKESILKFCSANVKISKLQGTKSFSKKSKTYESPESKADFMICSIDTLATGNVPRSILEPYGLLIVDEMHHLAANSLVHVVPMFPAKYTLGLTATPKRSDGLEHCLYWLMGPVASIYQRVPEVTGQIETVTVNYLSFKDGQQKEIVYYNGTLGFSSMITALTEDPLRNDFLQKVLVWCVQNRKRTIAVSAIVNHVNVLAKCLEPFCDTIAVMAGNRVERTKAKEAKLVLATYSLLEEGYDDPSLDTLVLLTPRSNIQQTIGRVEREYPGKGKPMVFDIVDSFSLFPNMFYKRKKFYSTRGFEIRHLPGF